MAQEGDESARHLISWAGTELGELANAVIRQLGFEDLGFDVVMTGSMFDGGEMLTDPMRRKIHELAPKARLVRLDVPPVTGAALLGMEAAGLQPTATIRNALRESLTRMRTETG